MKCLPLIILFAPYLVNASDFTDAFQHQEGSTKPTVVSLSAITAELQTAMDKYDRDRASGRANIPELNAVIARYISEEKESRTAPKATKAAASENGITGEAAPTPYSEILRVLDLLPKPEKAFADLGCGSEARWLIAAAEKWDCKCIGIEIDPTRVAIARERVRNAGLSHLITIIEGDATTTEVQADVAALFLLPETIEKMKPRLGQLRAFASYQHPVAGLTMTKSGDSFIYVNPITGTPRTPAAQPTQVVAQPRAAVWGNHLYSGPVCSNPDCSMCASIRAQLATPVVTQTPAVQPKAKAPAVRSGYWAKVCYGPGRCQTVWIDTTPKQ